MERAGRLVRRPEDELPGRRELALDGLAGHLRRGRGVRHPFRKKPDDNLTTEMALVWFDGVMTTKLRMPGTEWTRRPTTLSEYAQDVLQLLGIDEMVFSRPPPRWKLAGSAE